MKAVCYYKFGCVAYLVLWNTAHWGLAYEEILILTNHFQNPMEVAQNSLWKTAESREVTIGNIKNKTENHLILLFLSTSAFSCLRCPASSYTPSVSDRTNLQFIDLFGFNSRTWRHRKLISSFFYLFMFDFFFIVTNLAVYVSLPCPCVLSHWHS